MKGLKKLTGVVKEVLVEYPLARGDNNYLYFRVCQEVSPLKVDLPFSVAMAHREECGFPPLESVLRARRKVQRAYPELSADDTIEGYRKELEEEFRNYARKKTV